MEGERGREREDREGVRVSGRRVSELREREGERGREKEREGERGRTVRG